MKMSLVKKALESNKSFQGWKKDIGLSFEDFDVVELIKNDTRAITHKEGKKDIGKYTIFIKDGEVDSFCFDVANETVRQNTLRKIALMKAS